GNEVNEFCTASRTWNPNGRPMDPTTRLYITVPEGLAGTLYPASPGTPAAYWPDGLKVMGQGGPPAYEDTGNNYPNGAVLDHVQGRRLYPSSRQTYGGVIYMPSVKKVFWIGGVAYTSNGNVGVPATAEWNPTTKKYEVITPWELDKLGYATANICSAWDSTRNRVILLGGFGLSAYDPVAPYGSRITVYN